MKYPIRRESYLLAIFDYHYLGILAKAASDLRHAESVTFGFEVMAYFDRDFYPADELPSRAHWLRPVTAPSDSSMKYLSKIYNSVYLTEQGDCIDHVDS